jgi:glycosyltransferase involved in cell wall biosynthesis
MIDRFPSTSSTTQSIRALPSYVVLTPARNESQFIELTIQSVVTQVVRPLRWVIISDGSTDGTDEIVQRYVAIHPWIELLRMPDRTQRHFAGKVNAINAGRARVAHLPYEVIACLDADISFESDYFSFLLEQLASDPNLGLVGTPYIDTSSQVYDYRFVSQANVSGACQVFRRQCFDDIGGYAEVKGGAIDTIASISARMKGWKTHTFTERQSLHHRMIGTAESGAIRARFFLGQRDYSIGNHPLWEGFRGIYQMTKKPWIIRGLALMAGYAWACLRHSSRPVSREIVAFRRKEQMHHLATLFTRRVTPTRTQ